MYLMYWISQRYVEIIFEIILFNTFVEFETLETGIITIHSVVVKEYYFLLCRALRGVRDA